MDSSWLHTLWYRWRASPEAEGKISSQAKEIFCLGKLAAFFSFFPFQKAVSFPAVGQSFIWKAEKHPGFSRRDTKWVRFLPLYFSRRDFQTFGTSERQREREGLSTSSCTSGGETAERTSNWINTRGKLDYSPRAPSFSGQILH